MIHSLSLLVAFALCQEKPKEAVKDTEAEAFFKKVEEKFAKVKSLSYKATVVFKGGEEGSANIEAEGAIREGNKVSIRFKGKLNEKDFTASITCDGANTRFDGTMGEPRTEEAKKEFGNAVRSLFCRGGAFLPLFLADRKDGSKDDVQVVDLKFAKDEKVGDRAAKVLTFTLTIKDDNDQPSVTVWIDAETLAPLKRELKGKKGETMNETYTECKFDVELKDELFVVPKPEKKEEKK